MTEPHDPPGDPRPLPRVVVLNRDLFFGVRLKQVLAASGWAPELVPTTATLVAALLEPDPGAAPVALGIIDMAADPDWDRIAGLAATTKIPLLAFGPHKDIDAFRAAKAAGVTRVVSNGDFHRDMAGLVARYATTRTEPTDDSSSEPEPAPWTTGG